MAKARGWLWALRKDAGLRAEDVAEKVGVSKVGYWYYEVGRTTPRPSTAKKIAAILGFDWTKFYDEEAVGDGQKTQ